MSDEQSDVSPSVFAKWRTLHALAHADGVIATQERKFLSEGLATLPLTEEQKNKLRLDMEIAQDPLKMFDGITSLAEREDFMVLAEELFLCDGDYADEEKAAFEALRFRGEQHEAACYYDEQKQDQEKRRRGKRNVFQKLFEIFDRKSHE